MDLSETWQAAGERIGVEIRAPFAMDVDGRRHVCIAYVPSFGGPKGIVVVGTCPPHFETDKILIADAESQGYRWSFINVEEYQGCDDEMIKDALRDWGYVGPEGQGPQWLDKLGLLASLPRGGYRKS